MTEAIKIKEVKPTKEELMAKSTVHPRYNEVGLTKREYFAAMAMTGLCVQAIAGRHNSDSVEYNGYRAQQAVNMADALIKELCK